MSFSNFENNNQTAKKIGFVTKILIASGLTSSPQKAEKLMIPIAIVAFLLSIFFFYQALSKPTPPPEYPVLVEEDLSV
jgi:hypothetical protein